MLAGWQHELLTTGIFPYIRFNILISEQLASPEEVVLEARQEFDGFCDLVLEAYVPSFLRLLLTTQAIPVHKIPFLVWIRLFKALA